MASKRQQGGDHAGEVLRRLDEAYPEARVELRFGTPLELLVGRGHSGLLALCDAVELPEKTELQDWQWRFVLDHLESIRSVRIGLKRCAPEDLQGELRLLGELHAELLDRVTSSAV